MCVYVCTCVKSLFDLPSKGHDSQVKNHWSKASCVHKENSAVKVKGESETGSLFVYSVSFIEAGFLWITLAVLKLTP